MGIGRAIETERGTERERVGERVGVETGRATETLRALWN